MLLGSGKQSLQQLAEVKHLEDRKFFKLHMLCRSKCVYIQNVQKYLLETGNVESACLLEILLNGLDG